jgi:hypothetical protein
MALASFNTGDAGDAGEGKLGHAGTVVLSEADKRRRKTRSLALAWGLFALAVLFFLVTLVRLGSNVGNRPF